MNLKKYFYMVGNAHLDPVWLWRWQEGSAEAKATIRSALDRMNEDPGFVFVCSSMSVYKWVEDFSPEMFEEVRKRVKEGRFKIVGGWYVQPDCNNPSGEGFARQSLYSQRWFFEKFGVTAETGYDVDSFGHNLSIPQILRRSGMKNYVFMRPGEHEKHMETNVFHWTSPDGSEVLSYRIPDPYCHNFNSEEEIDNRLAQISERPDCGIDCAPFFYGVGNHGGGPTKRNLELIRDARKRHPESEFIYSDLTDFFDHIREEEKLGEVKIPSFHDDLQHHASGCYSAVTSIKEGIRHAENALLAAEKFSTVSMKLLGREYPDFKRAWLDVCFCHFHDSMGGCSIQGAYEDAKYMYGEALAVAARAQNNALQSISWAIGTDRSEGTPVVVFNPHPWPVKQVITVNAQAQTVKKNGRQIPLQYVLSPTKACMGREDTIFEAEIPPMGWSVYRMCEGDREEVVSEVKAEEFALENSLLRVEFERRTGYIKSMIDKSTGTELVKGRAAVPVVIDEYEHDTWSHGRNYFDKKIGQFADARFEILENGPVRACIKVVSTYEKSELAQYFRIESGKKELEVTAKVNWREKHKMLKYAWSFDIEDPTSFYEIPFCHIERPANGEEEPGLAWAAVSGKNYAVGITNDGRYSHSIKGGEISVTAVRSPIYADHGGCRHSELPFTDQGESSFKYCVMPMEKIDFSVLTRSGKELNQPLVNIIENCHSGELPEEFTTLSTSEKNITVTAVKKAEDCGDIVIRAVETEGRACECVFEGQIANGSVSVAFKPYEIKTVMISKDGCREVLITEFEE